MKDKYIDDLKEIKEVMHKSSRFIALSGLSGISAGIIALIGAYVAYITVFKNETYLQYSEVALQDGDLIKLIVIAILTLVAAFSVAIYYTTHETKKRNLKIWDHQSKRFLLNLFIPLVTGGILSIMLVSKGFVGVIFPLMLIFYGLALINASKYTLAFIRNLGLVEIIIGLFAMKFIGYGLLLWALGFGVVHIIYGLVFLLKIKL